MMEREQEFRSVTESSAQMKRWILACVLVILLCVVGFMIYKVQTRYVPPEFEGNAETLTQEVMEENQIVATETPNEFEFALSPEMKILEDGSLQIFAGNVSSNTVNLQYLVKDAAGKTVLYESGVLKPGEYVEKLSLQVDHVPASNEIVITINAFEPDTWYSKGQLNINFVIGK